MRNDESGLLNEVSRPKEGSEMNDFFLNQGKSFKAWAPHLYPNFPWELPPGLKFGLLPVTGPLYNSNLPLTQSNFQFLSDHFQYNFTLENSNSR